MSQAKPLTHEQRVNNYANQNGPDRSLTAAQVRQLRKTDLRREHADEEEE